MALCLAVVSGKGGTGKSTLSAGLAIAFSNSAQNVLLIDMDEGLRCLDMMLGIDGDVIFDLADILEGAEVSDATYKSPTYERLDLIPAPGKTGKIDPEAFSSLMDKIQPLYDVIILDFPAGTDFELLKSLNKTTRFITVCNPDPVSVRDAAVVENRLSELEITSRLIINRFDSELIKNRTYRNIDDIIDTSGMRLLGIVYDSLELKFLPITHSLKKRGKALKQLNRIMGRLCGKDIKLPRLK